MNKTTRAKCEARRDIIRRSLHEIAAELGDRLRAADLHHPVYLVVPSTGNALVSMMTPFNPCDDDWRRVGTIVRDIVSSRLDGVTVRAVEMPCATADAAMGAAEISGD
jgi:hypothetical protein